MHKWRLSLIMRFLYTFCFWGLFWSRFAPCCWTCVYSLTRDTFRYLWRVLIQGLKALYCVWPIWVPPVPAWGFSQPQETETRRQKPDFFFSEFYTFRIQSWLLEVISCSFGIIFGKKTQEHVKTIKKKLSGSKKEHYLISMCLSVVHGSVFCKGLDQIHRIEMSSHH